ncbi:hypothetical protein GCM10007939_04910 [Amylibacter marinus]|uniref:Uncharacterized protein n=1 Tax=Amylibacter marinus TaxID=1475483 RepID=A0ABQ5VS16_9RHOB|nr:hypothetical protein [Amylibacter marinus]GLQ34208.1 hypothetical protein GCM10007939_04910 [Amylibacter marinus]
MRIRPLSMAVFVATVLASVPVVAQQSNRAECRENTFKSDLSQKCLPVAAGQDVNAVNGEMQFKLRRLSNSPNATWIAAEGRITKDTPARFQEFLDSNSIFRENRIEFNSPGGDLYAGMELGRMIRAQRLNTTIGRTLTLNNPEFGIDIKRFAFSTCASACAYAFMGGVRRWLDTTNRIGLHRFGVQDFEFTADEAQIVSSDIALYLEEMGVDQNVLRMASRFDFSTELFYVPDDLARETGIVFDPSENVFDLDVELFQDHVVANASVKSSNNAEFNFRFHCIDKIPKIMIWGKRDEFADILVSLKNQRIAFISQGHSFAGFVSSGMLNDGQVFLSITSEDLWAAILNSNEFSMGTIYPPNWEDMGFSELINWTDASRALGLGSVRFTRIKSALPIVLRECGR